MSNPLLDLISRGESGTAGYNAYNRGTYVDADGKSHIRGPAGAIDFSSLTLGQVNDRQHLHGSDPQRLFAVGKYQVIPATMDGAIASLQLDRNQRFTPELQDRIFSEYLIVDKRPQVHDYIVGKAGSTLAGAQHSLSLEWASFGDPDNGGRSHYPPPNVASISLAQSGAALEAMRNQYREDVARGLSPAQAWQHVVDAGQPARTDGSPATDRPATRLLQQGDHGEDVKALQQSLAKLGYTGAQGHALKDDGVFGPNTVAAVEAFQRDHRLAVDGKVGAHTREALAANRNPATPLEDARHPDHALYQQALAGVAKIDAGMGRDVDQYSRNLAASLVPAAKAAGMTRIDGVALTEDGSRTFAVQNQAGVKLYADVPTAQAVHTPAAQSSVRALATALPGQPETAPTAEISNAPARDAGRGM